MEHAKARARLQQCTGGIAKGLHDVMDDIAVAGTEAKATAKGKGTVGASAAESARSAHYNSCYNVLKMCHGAEHECVHESLEDVLSSYGVSLSSSSRSLEDGLS